MARAKFGTLTEQMYYILLCLRQECCGIDIMAQVNAMTGGQISVGSGTLYNLLDQFLAEGFIRETRVEADVVKNLMEGFAIGKITCSIVLK